MKLYVWPEFCPDYNDGLAFAIAENMKQAYELLEKAHGRDVGGWAGRVEEHELDKPIAFACVGGS